MLFVVCDIALTCFSKFCYATLTSLRLFSFCDFCFVSCLPLGVKLFAIYLSKTAGSKQYINSPVVKVAY